MTVLENDKHERFAQYLVDGHSQKDSYALAGYIGNKGNACTLANHPDVVARVEDIKEERKLIGTMPALWKDDYNLQPDVDLPGDGDVIDLETDTLHKPSNIAKNITKGRVLNELWDNMKRAKIANQFAQANKSLELVGKELGMFGEDAKRLANIKRATDDTPIVAIGEIGIPELSRALEKLAGSSGEVFEGEYESPNDGSSEISDDNS